MDQKTNLERRKCKRFVVPGATVSYKVTGLMGLWKDASYGPCPLVDLSKGGLSFLTNDPPAENRKVRTRLYLSDDRDLLSLEGRVVAVLRNPGESYKYRIGIQFDSFSDQNDYNTLACLKEIDDLEKICLQQQES